MTPMLLVSPLSPERVWAMFASGPLTRPPLSRNHLDTSTDFFARNQRRPIRYNLADRRTALTEAGRAGRAVEHEGNQFACEAIHGTSILAANADPELHFGERASYKTTSIT